MLKGRSWPARLSYYTRTLPGEASCVCARHCLFLQQILLVTQLLLRRSFDGAFIVNLMSQKLILT